MKKTEELLDQKDLMRMTQSLSALSLKFEETLLQRNQSCKHSLSVLNALGELTEHQLLEISHATPSNPNTSHEPTPQTTLTENTTQSTSSHDSFKNLVLEAQTPPHHLPHLTAQNSPDQVLLGALHQWRNSLKQSQGQASLNNDSKFYRHRTSRVIKAQYGSD